MKPIAVLLVGFWGAVAMAQPAGTGPDNRPPCAAPAPVATPATPASPGQAAGTSPGTMGSTGWTGGTGGSNIGTTPSGSGPSSPNPQPDVARGLDPARPGPGNQAC